MPHPRQTNLAHESFKIFIPGEYSIAFEVNHIENKPEEWIIELVEKEDRVPDVLKGKDVVLDGYCNEIDILTHAFSLKKIYLCPPGVLPINRYKNKTDEGRPRDRNYSNISFTCCSLS